MKRPRPRADGFTLMEVMVALALSVVSLVGITALFISTIRANRLSRGLERAKVYAAQIMEVARQVAPDQIVTEYADVVTPDGVTYHRSCSVAAVTGTSLVVVTAASSFTDETDGVDHGATVQLVRTTLERL